ncbi:MAG: hypothetical protein FJZ00_14490 [Candidatus Sericytochromatia bacterium]|uniref:Uncharacterized protein n=1 Tax=Candidatus Tanganyikabacteria bacterium TaxID=2961651 RepID=A0A937X910_9BACT|nr:hypothetical protein [Candidatus Tanganyikabacteria bacterium]
MQASGNLAPDWLDLLAEIAQGDGLVVGTSGATNLPNQIAERAYRHGAAVGLIDPNASPFSRLAERRGRRGHWERGSAGRWLPPMVDVRVDHSRGRPGS